MSADMEVVDATLRGEDRRLIDAARSWAGSSARTEAIRSYQELTGASAYRSAEIVDQSSAAEFREERERQAEAERRRDAAEGGHWLAERHTAENYARLGVTPPGSPLEVARHHSAMIGDGPGRDPGAAYGSPGAPAVFASTPGGGLVDLGYQRERQHAQAQRSLAESLDDDLIARAHEQANDSYMRVQISRAHQRRAVEARRHHEAELARLATRDATYNAAMADRRARGTAELERETTQRAASGLGWPEYPEITRTTRDAVVSVA